MMPNNTTKKLLIRVSIITVCLLVLLAVAVATRVHWLPLLQRANVAKQGEDVAGKADSHEGHDHAAHAGHDEATSLELSPQAQRNIGLTAEKLQPIKLGTFIRTLNVPARVVERPGHTKVQVAAPMTGVIAAVHIVQGEAINPGDLLFTIKLTHEDLVQAQTVFLKTMGELDVEEREIKRLSGLDVSGVIAGKRLLERKYSKQKLEAFLNAHREALLLHGLSAEQIDDIASNRRLLRQLEVRAPALPIHGQSLQQSVASVRQVTSTALSDSGIQSAHMFTVQAVNVHVGSTMQVGDPLAVLADLDELFVEGRAFEHDAEEITHAARMQAAGEPDWEITAVLENNGRGIQTVDGLKLVYVDNEVETDSRAQRFYVDIPNQVLQDTTTPDGHRFVTWRFKPGQRMQLRVPVEQWKDRIVLPVDAIAQEGAETFAFLQNGDHFDRRPVHVEYRDQLWVVVANDGSLFPGDTVALTGAHQMQVALKNKAGGGVDPHAGHNH